jgi:hypothetical protein
MILKAGAAALSLAVVVAWSGLARSDASPRPCRSITGTVATQQADGACPSPVGICFSGTLETTSALRGETFFVVSAAAPDPSDPSLLHYTGILTVTHPSGSVTTFDTSGSVNQLTGEFLETDRAQSPNDAALTISGTTNATLTAFTGTITGELCTMDVARVGP